jgi:DNA polymerase elongation subunit (family B)
VEQTSGTQLQHWLFGCDATPGIVSVFADTRGAARVWRRVGPRVEVTDHHFSNWFLVTTLELLAHLHAEHVPAAALRAAHGGLIVPPGLIVVELEGAAHVEDAYRYLVLTDHLAEVETNLVDTVNNWDGGEAQSLSDLRGLVLAWSPVEQFLSLTGRAYYRGLRYVDLHRLQFDLETTGLNDERDRIFMISLRDSSGWTECLDTQTQTEADLLERFVALVHERDPDVLENHNIFAFDLPFLVRRAARLGVRLGLGRDGSEPELETDVFDAGERIEPFLRWRVRGREVVDTQHAVRRYGAAAPDLRRHGLKDAARYFGFAKIDREYVPGAEIWPTYQTDPERVRRYAADDVEEVDGLSRRLLPAAVELARILPRRYEQLAADTGPDALWEPLLVRAYLHEGSAVGAPAARLQRVPETARADLRMRGVVGHAVRATFTELLPSVLANDDLRAAHDDLGVLPAIVRELLRLDSASALIQTSHAYLSGHGLLSDPVAAVEASLRARRFVDVLLDELAARGCTTIESDGAQVLFATPADWTEANEVSLASGARDYLPSGVRLEFPGHYQALYARAPHSAVMLGYDGTVTLVGSTFRPGRLERFGEAFIRHAAPLILTGETAGVRRMFLDTVHQLRTAQLPLEDLSVQVTLHKSPPQYRRGGTHEEPYEVLLAAGVRFWRVGQRIRYFRARGGEPRLLLEGEPVNPAESDTEYYVQRLVSLYCQQYAQAFTRADFQRLFRVPAGSGPFTAEADIAEIRSICEAL